MAEPYTGQVPFWIEKVALCQKAPFRDFGCSPFWCSFTSLVPRHSVELNRMIFRRVDPIRETTSGEELLLKHRLESGYFLQLAKASIQQSQSKIFSLPPSTTSSLYFFQEDFQSLLIVVNCAGHRGSLGDYNHFPCVHIEGLVAWHHGRRQDGRNPLY